MITSEHIILHELFFDFFTSSFISERGVEEGIGEAVREEEIWIRSGLVFEVLAITSVS